MFPCCTMGSLPQACQFCINSASMSPPHGQLSSPNCCSVGHTSTGCSPSRTSCSSERAVLSMGFPQDHSLLWASPAPARAPPGAAGGSLLPRALPGLQGHSCLSLGCSRGCRGISVPIPGAAPAPPALPWLAAGLFLLHVLTPFFSGHKTFFLLNMLSQRHYHSFQLAQP